MDPDLCAAMAALGAIDQPLCNIAGMHDLPLEMLTAVCLQLDLRDLVRFAAVCRRFSCGEGGFETAELPTKSPVVTGLREHVFPGGELVPRSRPTGCAESWVAYLARCARQRRCREAPPIATGTGHNLFVDEGGRLLTCGASAAAGHGDEEAIHSDPSPVAAMAGVRVRSVATGHGHALALGWDGRVYSWGDNDHGHLGQGDRLARPSPALVEGLESARAVAAALDQSFAVTQLGAVFRWGCALLPGAEDALRPIIVEGFGGVRVGRVCATDRTALAVGEEGQLFSWGDGRFGNLGHGDNYNQPSPKRVEALRTVRVIDVSVGDCHALALAEDGLVYAWGFNMAGVLGNPNVVKEPLPKPIEALRGVCVGSVAIAQLRSYAVADTGELWAWGGSRCPLGHGEQADCLVPKPIESSRGVKVDAVTGGYSLTLALADNGSVYAWGQGDAAQFGALGLGPAVTDARRDVPKPQRIPAVRVACGL
jgi:alpha-tubulin suppressor-like RCC1 family protein